MGVRGKPNVSIKPVFGARGEVIVSVMALNSDRVRVMLRVIIRVRLLGSGSGSD